MANINTPFVWKGGKLLLDLADFLESDPRVRGHFDMRILLGHKDGGDLRLTRQDQPDLHTCGTAACAMGWAPHVPSIHRAGLGYVKLCARDWYIGLHGVPHDYDTAAINLFGIERAAARHLFNPRSGHRTPKQVARNIRRFVKEEAKRRAKGGR